MKRKIFLERRVCFLYVDDTKIDISAQSKDIKTNKVLMTGGVIKEEQLKQRNFEVKYNEAKTAFKNSQQELDAAILKHGKTIRAGVLNNVFYKTPNCFGNTSDYSYYLGKDNSLNDYLNGALLFEKWKKKSDNEKIAKEFFACSTLEELNKAIERHEKEGNLKEIKDLYEERDFSYYLAIRNTFNPSAEKNKKLQRTLDQLAAGKIDTEEVRTIFNQAGIDSDIKSKENLEDEKIIFKLDFSKYKKGKEIYDQLNKVQQEELKACSIFSEIKQKAIIFMSSVHKQKIQKSRMQGRTIMAKNLGNANQLLVFVIANKKINPKGLESVSNILTELEAQKDITEGHKITFKEKILENPLFWMNDQLSILDTELKPKVRVGKINRKDSYFFLVKGDKEVKITIDDSLSIEDKNRTKIKLRDFLKTS